MSADVAVWGRHIHPTLYLTCDNLFTMELHLIHVSKSEMAAILSKGR